MKCYYFLILFFSYPSLFSMEAETHSEQSFINIQENIYQPKKLIDIALDFITRKLLEQSATSGTAKKLQICQVESLLTEDTKLQITFYLPRHSPLLWKLLSYETTHFFYENTKILQRKLIKNNILATLIAPLHKQKQICIIDLHSLNVLKRMVVSSATTHFEIAEHSNILFVFKEDKTVRIYELKNGSYTYLKTITLIEGGSKNTTIVNADGNYIFQWSNNSSIKIFSVNLNENLQFDGQESFSTDTVEINKIIVTSTGTLITICNNGCIIKIWHLPFDEKGNLIAWPSLLKTIKTTYNLFREIAQNSKLALEEQIPIFNSQQFPPCLYVTSLKDNSTHFIESKTCIVNSQISADGALILIPQGALLTFGEHDNEFRILSVYDAQTRKKIVSFNLEDEEFKSLPFSGFLIAPDNCSIFLYTEDGHFINIYLNLKKI